MAAIDGNNIHYDDPSGTLTVRNLVVKNNVDTDLANKATGSVQTKSVNYTMAEGDSGKTTYVDTDGVVITLPATTVGMSFKIVNAGADGAVGIAVSPNASDKIMGNGYTSADNKDAINTKATAKKGDFIELVADGANGWFVRAVKGIWAREA